MQYFYINQNSTLPTISILPVNTGRYRFRKFNECIQDASITFTMVNVENGNIMICNAPCSIRLINDGGCEDKYCIEYKWKKRDTRQKGTYEGIFTIKFNGNITSGDMEYPSGELIAPIKEKIYICIQ